MNFKAYDIINKRYIDLFKISLSNDGQIMAYETIDGEVYGKHQIYLTIDARILNNEAIVGPSEQIIVEPYPYKSDFVKSNGWSAWEAGDEIELRIGENKNNGFTITDVKVSRGSYSLKNGVYDFVCPACENITLIIVCLPEGETREESVKCGNCDCYKIPTRHTDKGVTGPII